MSTFHFQGQKLKHYFVKNGLGFTLHIILPGAHVKCGQEKTTQVPRKEEEEGEEEKEQTQERQENQAEEEQREREGGVKKLKQEHRMKGEVEEGREGGNVEGQKGLERKRRERERKRMGKKRVS